MTLNLSINSHAQALTALDPNLLDADMKKVQTEVQLTILCNLAACLIAMKVKVFEILRIVTWMYVQKWQSVIEMCNEVRIPHLFLYLSLTSP